MFPLATVVGYVESARGEEDKDILEASLAMGLIYLIFAFIGIIPWIGGILTSITAIPALESLTFLTGLAVPVFQFMLAIFAFFLGMIEVIFGGLFLHPLISWFQEQMDL